VARRLSPTPTPLGFDDADDELASILEVLEGADAYADWVVSLFRDRLGGEILEVGAGVGSITRRLVECGSVVAVEPSSRSAGLLAAQTAGDARVEVVSGTVDELPGDRRFDVAVLTNVLEHVPDDVGLLRSIHRRLARDGAVVCFVPAHPWLHSAFDDRVGHIRRYRRSQLAEVFGAAGFAVEQIRHVNAPGALAWLVAARLLRMTPSPATTRLYQRMILPVVARLESRRELPFGQSLLVIARPVDG
jgi:2-polyprenyl-3-methyl-5-hydroxy-6-metoxy-1,4-benzoquinol methylase